MVYALYAMRCLLWVDCILIITLVLLQTSKGGSLGGVFGGGASADSLLGTRAMSFLVKVTVVLSVLFLVLCLTLNRLGTRASDDTKYAPAASESGASSESQGGDEAQDTTASTGEGGRTADDGE